MVNEILEYLDNNFDIADDGVNSDIKGLDKEDFDEKNYMLPEVAVSEDEDDKDVNLFRIDLAKQLIGNFSSWRKCGRPSGEHLLPRHIENISLTFC